MTAFHRRGSWILAAVSVGATAAAVLVSLIVGEPFSAAFAIPFGIFAVVGALIASSKSRNPLWRIYMTVGVVGPITILGEGYAKWGNLPGREWVGWAASLSFPVSFGSILIFIPLLFPTGRFSSYKWRWVGIAGGIQIALATVAFVLGPGRLDCCAEIDNPAGIEALGGLTTAYLQWGFLALAVTGLVSFASVVLRYKAAGAEERLQLKWFLFAVGLLVLASLGGGLSEPLGLELEIAPLLIFPLAILALPVATGIAILKYRLYGIDLIINKTLVYGALTIALGAGYFGTVVLLQTLFRPFTPGSDLAIAGSTLAVAALFRPLRHRIQAFVDRRFYRGKYDAVKTVEAFSARLRQEIDLKTLTAELATVVGESMQPAYVSTWIREAPR